jgi:hypothetical protein
MDGRAAARHCRRRWFIGHSCVVCYGIHRSEVAWRWVSNVARVFSLDVKRDSAIAWHGGTMNIHQTGAGSGYVGLIAQPQNRHLFLGFFAAIRGAWRRRHLASDAIAWATGHSSGSCC